MSRTINSILLFVSCLLLVVKFCWAGNVIYVDNDATGADDGTSWTNAYVELQSALAAASYGDQIWVAAGTYLPDYDPISDLHTGDRTATFQLVTGVDLYGGFPSGGSSWEYRDPNQHETILSGDLDQNDGPNWTNYANNTYHVVTAADKTLINGFIIRSGNSNNTSSSYPNSYYYGGGLCCWKIKYTEIHIEKCVFKENYAVYAGGGAFFGMADVTMKECKFVSNQGLRGGGVYIGYGSLGTLIDCSFLENYTYNKPGGGLYIGDSSVFVINSIFLENTTPNCGGAIYDGSGDLKIHNCVFNGNHADRSGGGIYTQDRSYIDLSNSTFCHNFSAMGGGAIYQYNDGIMSIINSLFWENNASSGAQQIGQGSNSGIFISSNDIMGGIGGITSGSGSRIEDGGNNINNDPLFIDIDGPDNIAGNADDDFHLSAGSPCIDAGDNTAVPNDSLDLDGNEILLEPIPWDKDGAWRFFDDPDTMDMGVGPAPMVDMGAYEYGSQPSCGDINHLYMMSDMNYDCCVNLLDFSIFAAQWLSCNAPDCK